MRKLLFLIALGSVLSIATSAFAQRGDVAFGISGIRSASGLDATGNYSSQDVGGGIFPGFSGDFLIWHHLGVEGEVYWRGGQNTYNADLSGTPFRPVFWSINGIYAHDFSHHVGLDLLAGIGEESVRFYQNAYTNCDPFSGICNNYQSVGHLMGDFGAGLRLYVKGGFFVRPEARVYLVHNNFEFSSGHAERLGVSLGYTFGEH